MILRKLRYCDVIITFIYLPLLFVIAPTIALFLVALIALHEFGHYVVAKAQGIYKGWGIFPFFHIKVKKGYSNRFDYMSGVAGSLLSFPVFLFTGLPLWLFFLMVISTGPFDFMLMVKYPKVQTIKLSSSRN